MGQPFAASGANICRVRNRLKIRAGVDPHLMEAGRQSHLFDEIRQGLYAGGGGLLITLSL